jgi:hypothetical protein
MPQCAQLNHKDRRVDEYLNTEGAADFLKCSTHTLIAARKSGILWGTIAPKFIKIGRNVRYETSVLRDWMKSAIDDGGYEVFESKGARFKVNKGVDNV